jgi:hypothetical protein
LATWHSLTLESPQLLQLAHALAEKGRGSASKVSKCAGIIPRMTGDRRELDQNIAHMEEGFNLADMADAASRRIRKRLSHSEKVFQ